MKILSRIPWWVMLLFSNFMYWTVYRLFGYRKGVVTKNLKNSFPEKSDQEIRQIRHRFYRSFFDFVMETLKAVGISAKQMRKRVTFANPEFFEALPKDRGVIVLGTHLFNWELYGMAMSELFDRKIIFSYQQLSSKFSDNLMLNTRQKFGAVGVLRHETAKAIVAGRNENQGFYVLADQAPVGRALRYWTKFLNQNTAFYHGIGKVAKATGMPVVIILPKKVGRGYYKARFEWVARDSSDMSGEEILESYIRILENELRENPTDWLWSHKRWKTRWREGDIVAPELKGRVEK